jgi:hypothetical protein
MPFALKTLRAAAEKNTFAQGVVGEGNILYCHHILED